MKKRVISGVFVFLLILLVSIWIIRAVSPRQIDDVNPYINCEESLLKKSDVFYVIPLYKDMPINKSREWCDYILSFNKTLQIHGIRHTYFEFKQDISKEEMEYAISVFEDCFGKKPTNFKAPQLKISQKNKKMLKQVGLKLDGNINQIFHKAFHCEDTGFFSNRFHEFI